MRKLLFPAILLSMISVLAATAPAQAAPPQVQPGHVDLPARDANGGGYCPFPVSVDYVTKQRAQDSTNPDGSTSQRVTGYAFATVTNLSTGKALDYQVSGPGVWTYYPDQAFAFEGGGVNIFWTEYGKSYPGVPQLNYITGHVSFHVNATGLTTSYQLSGSSTDVCAALAQ
jgi:hypothetical protein